MHKHTIDWYQQINITADAALAEKRWSAAETFSKGVTRSKVLDVIRLFLGVSVDADRSTKLTNELVVIDTEFPVSNRSVDELDAHIQSGDFMLHALDIPRRPSAYELMRAKAKELEAELDRIQRCPHGVWKADHCWACNPSKQDSAAPQGGLPTA